MTKSATPKDKKLKKEVPKRRIDAKATESPALNSGFQDNSSDAMCMIQFKSKLKIEHSNQLDKNKLLTLVPEPEHDSSLVIFQDGRSYGRYTGSNTQTMLSCMKMGYTYRAAIISIDSSGVEVEIQGEGA